MESKKQIYDLISEQYKPHTLYFKISAPGEDILIGLTNTKLRFPLIAKPDMGMRDLGGEKNLSAGELLNSIELNLKSSIYLDTLL